MEYRAAHHHRALRSVEAYLLPDEEVVIASNQHWIVVAEPVFTCIFSFVLVVWVNATTNAAGGDLFWWVWFAIVLRTVWMLIDWRRAWFIATDQRFLKVRGIIVRNVAMMPLKKVTDITYDRTIPGQILQYGTFRFETAGQDQAFSQLRRMPHPNDLYRAIVEYVLGGPPKPSGKKSAPPAPPAQPRPMKIDFGDRTRSRDEELYQGGGGEARHHGEPDTVPFQIPEEWKRTDQEAPPVQRARWQGQVVSSPVQQPTGRTGSSRWWRRDKADAASAPQTQAFDRRHSVLRDTPHSMLERHGNRGSSPIIEPGRHKRGKRRDS